MDQLRRLLLAFAGCLWWIAWLNPNHYRPWMSFWNEMPALLSVWVLALGLSARAVGVAVPIPRLALWVGLIGVGLPLLHAITGLVVFAGDLVVYASIGLTAAVAIAVGHVLARDWHGGQRGSAYLRTDGAAAGRQIDGGDKRAWRAYWIWLPAVVASLIGVMQWLGLANALIGTAEFVGYPGGRAMGPIGHTSQMSVVCVIGLVAVWYERMRGGLGGISYGLMGGLLVAVLVLTQARIGLWALVAFALYASFMCWRRPALMPTSGVADRWSLWLFVLAALLLRALLPSLHEWLMVAEPRTTSIVNPNERHKLWHQMLEGALQSPWWGFGWNNSAAAQAAASDRFDTNGYSDYAHNMLIDLIAWTGFPVGITLGVLVGFWLVSRFSRVSTFDGFAASAGLVVLLLYAMTEFPFAYGYFLALGALLAGVVEASYPYQRQLVWKPRHWQLAAAGVLILLLSAAMTRDYARMQEDFGELRLKLFGVGEMSPTHQPPSVLILDQLYTMQAVLWRPIDRPWSSHELDQLTKVSKRSSYLQVRAVAALVFKLHGRHDDALMQLTIMHKRYGQGALRWYWRWLERYEHLSPDVAQLRHLVRSHLRDDPALIAED